MQAHLSDEYLSSLLLGKLPLEAMETAEIHLTECIECRERAAAASPHDEFVGLLVGANAVTKSVSAAPSSTGVNSRLSDKDTVFHAGIEESSLPIPIELVGHPRYRIRRLLGTGGMGTVWLAEHLMMQREVALKVIRPELLTHPGAIARFQREVRTTAKLHHPNLAVAHDAEQIGETFFLVMEYVPGQPLTELIKAGPLPIAEACRCICEAAKGLGHAHDSGLVHRDVKPGNILRTVQGEIKVVDFGLVSAIDADSSITVDNIVMGTPDFVSPEQALNPRSADARSDIYSLGCTLYQLLSGKVPFPDGSMVQKIDAHRYSSPSPIAQLPPGLWQIISRMLAKKPEERFQSAQDLIDDLQRFCDPTNLGAMNQTRPRSLHNKPSGFQTSNWLLLSLPFLCLGVFSAFQLNNQFKDSKSVGLELGAQVSVEGSPTEPLAADQLPLEVPVEHCFQKHSGTVRKVVFSPDSRTLFSCGDDGWVYGWEVETWRLSHEIHVGEPVRTIVCSKLDSSLFLGTSSGLLQVALDRGVPNLPITTLFREYPIQDVTISPDGSRVAALSMKPGWFRIWDCQRKEPFGEWVSMLNESEHTKNYSIAWSPLGTCLATACDEGVTLWNTQIFNPINFPLLNWRSSRSVNFSKFGKRLVVAGLDTGVAIHDTRTGKWISYLATSGTPFSATDPLGRIIVGTIREIAVWSFDGKQQLLRLTGSPADLVDCAISPDGQWLAGIGNDKSVGLWKISQIGRYDDKSESEGLVPPPPFHEELQLTEELDFIEWRPKVAFNPAGTLLFASSNWHPTATLIWNRSDGLLLAKNETVSEGWAFSLSPDGGTFAYQNQNELVLAKSVSGDVVKRLNGLTGLIWCSSFSPNGELIAAVAKERKLAVWNCQSGELVWTGKPRYDTTSVNFSANSQKLITTGTIAEIWSLSTTESPIQISECSDRACAMTHDMWQLLTCKHQELQVLNLPSGEIVRQFFGHPVSVDAVCISPDDRFAASGDVAGNICLWDFKTARLLYHFQSHVSGALHNTGVLGLAISPDGRSLLSSGKDGRVRLWRIPEIFEENHRIGSESSTLGQPLSK